MAEEAAVAENLRLFISYAHSDGRDLARRLAADLAASGHNVWLDQNRLSGGASWSAEIETRIDASDAVIALLSRGSYVSDICRAEQLRALRHKRPVIPVLVQPEAERPIHLETKQYILFDDAAAYPLRLQQLVDVLGAGESATLAAGYRSTYNTVPGLPRHFVPRPVELEKLRNVLISDNAERRIAVTALRGMGGIGKTVLSQVVCSDKAIQDAYPDGVMWAVIGQTPTDSHLIAQMREIAKALGDDLAGYDTLQGCGNQFRKTLAGKAALIVLDDVWNPRDVQPFLADAPRCRLLLTTRRSDVVKATAAVEYCLDVLDPEEARSLLERASGTTMKELSPVAAEIIEECGRLPLALAMIGALVRGETEDAWARVLRRLKAADLDRIRLQFPDYPHPSILRAIQVSVDSLGAEARSRYLELAVFPPDTAIPDATFQVYWGLDPDGEAEIVDAWVGASLASRTAHGVAFHDLQLDFVREQAGSVRELHGKLVESYRRLCRGKWASGPNDGYFFTWLPYHLVQAGQQEEIRALLLDPYWMRAKLASGSVAALLADYDYESNDPDFRLIQDALRLSAHVLAKHPGLLASQLAGRLRSVESAIVGTMVSSLGQAEDGPWFMATRQTLMPPGGSLLRTLEGHGDWVRAIAVTPDGKWAVSGSYDNTLKLWDLERGEAIRTLAGHTGWVGALALTSDGRRAVSGSDDNTLKVWDLERGEAVRTLTGPPRGINGVALMPDGESALLATFDNTLQIWDLKRGEAIRTLQGHSGRVNAVALTADGKRAVSGSYDHTLKVWDLERGKAIRTLTGHTGGVNAVALAPDGKRAVSGSADGTLRLWDLGRGDLIRTLAGHTAAVNAVALTPDGKRAVSGSADGALWLWDLGRGEAIRTLEGHGGGVGAVALTPDGRHAVTGSDDKTIKLWDLERGESGRAVEDHAGEVGAVALTPDGRRAVSGSADGTLKVWDLERSESIRTLLGHRGWVMAVALTADGKHAVSGSFDKTLKLWDLERGEAIRTLVGHARRVLAVAVTPGGGRAVSGSADKTLKVWDLELGQAIDTLEGHADWVWAVAVTPDGKHAVSGSWDKSLKLWDLENGQAIRTLEGHAGGVNAVALTPDGKRAVSGSYDNTLKVWDVQGGQAIRTLAVQTQAAVAVTPDGRRAVSGSDDNTLTLWDLETGQEIAIFAGESAITACAVSADGKTFVAGEASGCVHFLKLMDGHKDRRQRRSTTTFRPR